MESDEERTMEFDNQRVLVFGAGLSGIGAVKLLLEKDVSSVILYDGNKGLDREELAAKLPDDGRLSLILGELPEAEQEKLDLVILSPGVPTDLPLVQNLRRKGIRIWGEVELAWVSSKGEVLAVTGTNGKTTTTSLLGAIMRDYLSYPDRKSPCDQVFVVGNIGAPFTEAAELTTDKSVLVAEISSFQLETIESFAPHISAILNITPDHLNRHHTMEEYIRVKELITKNQGSSDYCILNYEDPILKDFGESLNLNVLWFSSARRLKKGVYLLGDEIFFNLGEGEEKLMSVNELQLLGTHNYENVMAAAAMALAYGVPPALIRKSASAFQAVEHRIEFVTEKGGVAYYNDSKGTNPDAAIKGIQAMKRPTYLIGGGYDKDSSYEEWIRAFDGKVKELVLIGETKEKIAVAAKNCGFENVILLDTLEDAVAYCAKHAQKGDAVLLSPACASWDMFPNYEVRGKRFKELVKELR